MYIRNWQLIKTNVLEFKNVVEILLILQLIVERKTF